jgi:hypothetical protein
MRHPRPPKRILTRGGTSQTRRPKPPPKPPDPPNQPPETIASSLDLQINSGSGTRQRRQIQRHNHTTTQQLLHPSTQTPTTKTTKRVKPEKISPSTTNSTTAKQNSNSHPLTSCHSTQKYHEQNRPNRDTTHISPTTDRIPTPPINTFKSSIPDLPIQLPPTRQQQQQTPSNNINFFSLNSNGMTKPKLTQTMVHIRKILDQPQQTATPTSTILAIQETHWHRTHIINSLNTNPFINHHTNIDTKFNKITRRGGTAFLVSPDLALQTIRRDDLEHNTYFQTSVIELTDANLIVANIYIIYHHQLLHSYLDHLASTARVENKLLLIMGDFNSYNQEWGSTKTDRNGRELEETTTASRLHILNHGEPTHGREALDLMFSSELVPPPLVHDVAISDHCLLHLTWKIDPIAGSAPHQPETSLSLKIANKNQQEFKSQVASLVHQCKPFIDRHQNDPETLAQTINIIIHNALHNTKEAKKNPREHHHNRWYTPEIGAQILKKRTLWIQFKKSPTAANKKKYSTQANKVTDTIRKAEREARDKLASRISEASTPKELWKAFQRTIRSPPPITIPADPNHTHNHIQDRLNSLNQHLTKLGHTTPPPTTTLPLPPLPHLPTFRIEDHQVSEIIKSSSPNKAPGHDNIQVAVLKLLPKIAIRLITTTFNASIKSATFPTCWKHAIIAPIPKRHPAKTHTDFRPISLLCTIGKILERIMAKQIADLAPQLQAIDPNQFGFRKSASTTHAVLNLTNDIHCHIHSNRRAATAVLLLDLTAAYDSVPHNALTNTMIINKFPPHIIHWTSNFIQNRTAQTRHFNQQSTLLSSQAHVTRGVPQGSPLSPILFSLFIDSVSIFTHQFNQSNKQQPYINHQLFADDMAFWVHGTAAPTTMKHLQNFTDQLHQLLKSLGLQVNTKKSTLTIFSKKEHKLYHWRRYGTIINGEPVTKTTSPKYLGLILDPYLKWDKQAKEAAKTMTRKIRDLRMTASSKTGASSKHLLQLYNGYARPTLLYAASTWLLPLAQEDHKSVETLARMDRRGKRLALGMLNTTPIHVVDTEASSPHIKLSVVSAAVKLANQLRWSSDQRWISISNNSPVDAPINKIMQTAKSWGCLDTRPLWKLDGQSPPTKISQAKAGAKRHEQMIKIWQEARDRSQHGNFHKQIAPKVQTAPQPHLLLNLPRATEVTITRIRTNHIYTNHYRHRMYTSHSNGPATPATCRYCGHTETTDHLLFHCKTLHLNSTPLQTLKYHIPSNRHSSLLFSNSTIKTLTTNENIYHLTNYITWFASQVQV